MLKTTGHFKISIRKLTEPSVPSEKIKPVIKLKPLIIAKTAVKPTTVVVKPTIKTKLAKAKGTLSSILPASFPRPIPDANLTISFDIGVINLAYCILHKVDDKYCIIDWNIINMASGNNKLLCSATIGSGAKSGTKCGKKAYYVDAGKGYCAIHGKGKNYERNMTVDNVMEFELKCKLFQVLDDNSIFLKVKTILIETQPTKAREKIKGIGHAIFDYYVLRGIIDKGCAYDELKFIDAKNKLTVYEGPPLSCHLKDQHARNKWYGKQYCQWIIGDKGTSITPELAYFNSFKKQDDLADCFLQAVWYLKYGAYGHKAPILSNHTMAQTESNILQYQRARPRMPIKKAKETGRYSLANIKYLLNKKTPLTDAKLRSSIEYFFGSIEAFEDSTK